MGVGFGLSDLDVVGIGFRSSILTTSGASPSDATSPPVLMVSAGFGPNMVSRINLWLNSSKLANAGLVTKSSKNEWFINKR